MTIIVIIKVFSAINCFLHSPRTGAIPWSWGTRGDFYLMDRHLLSMCAVSRRVIFCSSLMLLAPGIFPKFWSIPFLMLVPVTNNNRRNLCPHSPHSRGFNLKIFVFWELFNDFRLGVSVGWYRYIYKFGTLIDAILLLLLLSLSLSLSLSLNDFLRKLRLLASLANIYLG